MTFLIDKINSLEDHQLGTILIVLGKFTLEELKELQTDCNLIAGLDSRLELRNILLTELYYTLTNEELNIPSSLIKPRSINYMESIRQACGR